MDNITDIISVLDRTYDHKFIRDRSKNEYFTRNELISIFPPGWKLLIDYIIPTLDFFGEKPHYIHIGANGTLFLNAPMEDLNVVRFVTKNLINNADKIKDTWKNIAYHAVLRTIALDSTQICCMCGKKGNIRRDERRTPILCAEHYIQYINEIEEEIYHV